MARRRDEDDDLELEEGEEEQEVYGDDEEEEDYDYEDVGGGGKAGKRTRSQYIEDAAGEVDEGEEEEEEEEEEDEEEDYARNRHRPKRGRVADFLDDEAVVDSDEDEEEEDGEDDFIDNGADLPDEDDGRMHRRPLLRREDEQEDDVEDIARRLQERYRRSSQVEYDEETTDVEQQALLPSVKDTKLWMVKCAIGREREVAVCLMQKFIDRGGDLQIRSVVALDHLKNYIYIEADKEAHAIKGMRNIYASSKLILVPIKEMTDVLSVESKAIDLSRDTWVRMKSGTYKGDLAKVVDVDNVRQRVTVKLIPRIDLQALANKLEGREVAKKKAFVPPPRFMNVEEARELHIRVERRRDPMTGEYFENIGGMMFKDGFMYKTMSMKSISTQNIQPTFDELEKFRQPNEGDGDIASLSTLFANRKKGHFMKGDAVIVVKGDLKNLKGWVEKVEDGHVHIRPIEKGLPLTLAINEKELCKYFEPGNHVKVVSGSHEGVTGMVVKVEGHVLIILSDTTKEHIRVFADHVVESSEVTTGITSVGDYELHDLVLLDNMCFGVIIRVESEAFQVLKGIPDRPEVVLVRLREIKSKIDDKKWGAQDRKQNAISVKDVVRVLEGPSKGKQGPVEHIYRGVLFIYDRHHLEHAGFICAKSQSCLLVGGSRSNREKIGGPLTYLRTPQRIPQSPGRLPPRGPSMDSNGSQRGGRGHDSLVGTTVKIRIGPFKGYRGRVKDIKGTSVRIELESQMKVVTVDRNHISDNVNITTPYRDMPRYGIGSETPMHPSRTPMHPFMTPMRDPGATPIHDGMRTPMRDRAWNPYAPMSPPRDNWEDANPASWGTTPQYRPGSPPSRPYEAPTPGSGWASTPGGNCSEAGTPKDSASSYPNAPSPYLPSTPGQPMTPSSTFCLPGTPGVQPMTPGGAVLDMMSPMTGADNEGPWVLPDILVNVHKSGEDPIIGVVREVLSDGSCRVALGSSGSGEMVTALPNEIEVILPKKSDKIKIMGGGQRGATGKLIGVDGTDGIVKVDDTLDVKILDMAMLAKLAQT
ncbi:hypothetical protein Ancab_038507 [Ancistrocladus abbreviatus]